MQAGLDYDGSENKEPVSDEIHLMEIKLRHTNSTTKISRDNVRVLMMNSTAVCVFTSKAPQACIDSINSGCVISVFQVGRWSSGNRMLYSAKKRYTTNKLSWYMRLDYKRITHNNGSSPRESECLMPTMRSMVPYFE